MTTATTVDANGELVTTTITPPVATVQFSRKNGLPNYSNEECGIFIQIPLEEGASPEQIEKILDPQVAFAKAYVYKQLGVASEVAPNGVIVGAVPVEQPKKAGGRGPQASKPKTTTPNVATTDDEKNDLWAELAGAVKNGDNWKTQNGETVWDNREDKKNPRAPDFKFADSGKALWMSDAPEFFSGPGEGLTL